MLFNMCMANKVLLWLSSLSIVKKFSAADSATETTRIGCESYPIFRCSLQCPINMNLVFHISEVVLKYKNNA